MTVCLIEECGTVNLNSLLGTTVPSATNIRSLDQSETQPSSEPLIHHEDVDEVGAAFVPSHAAMEKRITRAKKVLARSKKFSCRLRQWQTLVARLGGPCVTPPF